MPDVLATFDAFTRLSYPILLHSGTTPGSIAASQTESPLHSSATVSMNRYTFAAAEPTLFIRATGRAVEIQDLTTGTIVREQGRALDFARNYLKIQPESENSVELPPFQGGWAGLIGYEYGGVLENIPRAETLRHSDVTSDSIPDVVLAWYPWVVAWDHQLDRAWIFAEDDAMLERVATLLQPKELPSELPRRSWNDANVREFDASFSRDEYETAVERVRSYISAGDVFQVNLSQRFAKNVEFSPWTYYRQMHAINPAPFSAYFDFGSGTAVSASPERFLHLSTSGIVETRPIKGTRPRSINPTDDAAQQRELLASEKDAAEHVMIVDVLRNDIARVCQFGSVHVPELMTLETYATVHHLVSTVTGTLRPEHDAIDLLHAAFPGGSITGAPKVRAMEIIAELEPVDRHVYCGAIGYLSRTGAMDTSIAIRTAVMLPARTGGYRFMFSAGGGIVYDSTPSAEYEETLDKARALMQAALTLTDKAHTEQPVAHSSRI